MRIVKPATVRGYAQQHPDARGWLDSWMRTVLAAEWHSIQELRTQYPHADAVRVASGRTVTVFNVRGNRYRLIVAIHCPWGMVYVLRFLTHAQYDKDQWKGEL
jgi:mRNA interferase HigB